VAFQSESCLQANAWICADYVRTRADELVTATSEHVILTVVSVVLGFLIALPLAVLSRRYTRLRGGVLGITTAIYTIPSLALFSILVPFTGLGAATVITALALYSLTILVRNVLAGLLAVPPDVQEAARGMGYGSARLLFTVELPLALPAILAGLRVATVSTVSLVTIGALIGTGGLGNLIYEGFGSFFRAQVLTASVLCVVLAVIADLALIGANRVLTPWRRGVA
jgi:osmoprotectant transport system permease protein